MLTPKRALNVAATAHTYHLPDETCHFLVGTGHVDFQRVCRSTSVRDISPNVVWNFACDILQRGAQPGQSCSDTVFETAHDGAAGVKQELSVYTLRALPVRDHVGN